MKIIKRFLAIVLVVGLVLSTGSEYLYATETKKETETQSETEGKNTIELNKENIKKYILLFGQFLLEYGQQLKEENEKLEQLEELEKVEKWESNQSNLGEDVWIYIDGVVVNESTKKPISNSDYSKPENTVSFETVQSQLQDFIKEEIFKEYGPVQNGSNSVSNGNATNVIYKTQSFEEGFSEAVDNYLISDYIPGLVADKVVDKYGENFENKLGTMLGNNLMINNSKGMLQAADSTLKLVGVGAELIESMKLLGQYIEDKDPTTALKTTISTLDTAEDLAILWAGMLTPTISSVLAVPTLFCGLNKIAWDYGVETKEWKQFAEENRGNMVPAMFNEFIEGTIKAVKDLPREWVNIITGGYISEERYKEMSVLDFYLAYLGQLIPMPSVNVYKPNIYLYADAPLEVQVEFLQENLLTETIPEYSLGWDTLVQGDGSLACQGETYDFLFYESLAEQSLFQKETGWIIYADTREAQLLEVLKLYDFNEKETKDFMEFWMEKLEPGVDFVMYPQDTAGVDIQMPIEIAPVPTNITRIWFGFETYEGQVLEVPQVEPIQRGGFTVVEWGGFILDEMK